MAENKLSFDLQQVKRDIITALSKCTERGLAKSARWLAELNSALKGIKPAAASSDISDDSVFADPEDMESQNETDNYLLGKCYFDVKEYDRCAFFTESCQLPKTKFLHLFSRYLSGEKKKLDDMVDSTVPVESSKNNHLKNLRVSLQDAQDANPLDGFCLYLFGVVLKKLDLQNQALQVLLEAVHKEPMMWGSWLELAGLVTDRAMLNSLTLPDHWMKNFFLGHTYLEHQMNEEALQLYWGLQEAGFDKSTYVLAQTAIAFHNKRDIDRAIESFRVLQEVDPYRLDNMDIFSNLLYVKELRVDLSHLAHQTCKIDKYRVETCCVIGNYYSLRSEHQKAVLYFQRALKLNPNYLSAWTLMGHEFMEMKNTSAAIQSYRQAIEVNRRDYRAWYGLGQTYEIIKMPYYCLYYYKQAQCLRPNDSRMLIALGEAYEKLDRVPDAVKCYSKAHCVGDVEGVALLRLAKLFEKLNKADQAAAAYDQYVQETESQGIVERDEQSQAYKYLANYFLKKAQLDQAYNYAQKCLECADTKEEGKALLRAIAVRRCHQEDSAGVMQVEEPNSAIQSRSQENTPSNSQLTPMNLSFTP